MNDTSNIVQQSIKGLIHRVDQSSYDPLTSQGLAPNGQVFAAWTLPGRIVSKLYQGSGCDVGQLLIAHLTLALSLLENQMQICWMI